MEKDLVLLDYLENGIARITLNNPPLNLNSLPFTRRLEEIVMSVEHDNRVRVVILTGAGSRAFSAGSDIKEFPALSDNFSEKKLRRENSVFSRLADLPKPVIGALNSHALGGGFELALTCDFRILAADAKVGFPEIKLGSFPGSGGMFRLPRLVGIQKAKRIMFLGQVLPAAEALELGLVDEVVDSEQVMKRAMEFALSLSAQPLYAIRSIKKALNAHFYLNSLEATELALQLTEQIFKTNDAKEGYNAFVEKRQPVWENAPQAGPPQD